MHFTVGLCRLEQQFCLRFFVIYVAHEFKSNHRPPTIKLAFHDADTDILARIVAIMSACRSACYRKLPEIARVGRVGEDVRVGFVEFLLYTAHYTFASNFFQTITALQHSSTTRIVIKLFKNRCITLHYIEII